MSAHTKKHPAKIAYSKNIVAELYKVDEHVKIEEYHSTVLHERICTKHI